MSVKKSWKIEIVVWVCIYTELGWDIRLTFKLKLRTKFEISFKNVFKSKFRQNLLIAMKFEKTVIARLKKNH